MMRWKTWFCVDFSFRVCRPWVYLCVADLAVAGGRFRHRQSGKIVAVVLVVDLPAVARYTGVSLSLPIFSRMHPTRGWAHTSHCPCRCLSFFDAEVGKGVVWWVRNAFPKVFVQRGESLCR